MVSCLPDIFSHLFRHIIMIHVQYVNRNYILRILDDGKTKLHLSIYQVSRRSLDVQCSCYKVKVKDSKGVVYTT